MFLVSFFFSGVSHLCLPAMRSNGGMQTKDRTRCFRSSRMIRSPLNCLIGVLVKGARHGQMTRPFSSPKLEKTQLPPMYRDRKWLTHSQRMPLPDVDLGFNLGAEASKLRLMATSASSIPNITGNARLRWSRVPVALRLFAALLVLLGIVSVLAGVSAHQRVLVIREVEQLRGGTLSRPVVPMWLRNILGWELIRGFDDIEEVWFDGHATDDTIRKLRSLTTLKQLYLSHCQISDHGLAALTALPNLRRLDLRGTKVTDSGLHRLKSAKSMEWLGLASTQITDDGIANLQTMQKLKWLVLDHTPITDAAVAHLEKISDLKTISVRDTRLSPVGLRRLKKSLPRLSIVE